MTHNAFHTDIIGDMSFEFLLRKPQTAILRRKMPHRMIGNDQHAAGKITGNQFDGFK